MNPLSSINDYVWNVLRQELGWTKINNLIPMLPTREQPEFDDQTKPYILYAGSRETGRGDITAIRTATVQYLIYASNTSQASGTKQISDAIALLDQALNRLDDSARDINMNARAAGNPRRAAFNDMFVTYTRVTNTDTADPSENEGGKVRGYISVRYAYTVQEREFPILY